MGEGRQPGPKRSESFKVRCKVCPCQMLSQIQLKTTLGVGGRVYVCLRAWGLQAHTSRLFMGF